MVPMKALVSAVALSAVAAGCAVDAPAQSAAQHLSTAQCEAFDVNGTTTICHATGSARNPTVVLRVSTSACINGHADHASDRIAVDGNCGPDACLPVGAPADDTLACCSLGNVTRVGSACACAAGFANCDGEATNGCEVDLNTVANCGACGVACAVSNGTPSCSAGACGIKSCHAGYTPSGGACVPDGDHDAVPDSGDNCPTVANADQRDTNGDQQGDACECLGVTCAALDQCHTVGTCDPTDGVCSNPSAADGTSCSDGDSCTPADTCQAGTCGSGAPVNCQNGGTCNSSGASYTCTCAAGFTGTHCETRIAGGPATRIWAPDFSTNTIRIYDIDANGQAAPSQVIQGASTGLRNPSWCQISGDELFVANPGASTVNVYSRNATGNAAPLRTIIGAQSFGSDYGIFVEGGELFVASYGASRITVLPQGAGGIVNASRVLTSGDLGASIGIFVGDGELFTARYYTGGYAVHSRGAQGFTPALRTVSSVNAAFGIWATATEVFVTDNSTSPSQIRVFARAAAGTAAPLRTLTMPSGSGFLGQLTVNGSELVVNSFTGIYTFPTTASGSAAPLRRIVQPTSSTYYGACLDLGTP